MKILAKIISLTFHPLIIPTLGVILLFNTGFYFSMLAWEIKRFVLIAVFFSTCILPVLTIAILALSPKFDYRMDKHTDRVLPLLFSSIYYFVGYQLLGKLNIYPVFKIILISSVVVLVIVSLISFKWKISNHMVGIGGFTGTILAVSLQMGINPVINIIGTIIVAGLIGSARLYLQKHTLSQVLAGFALGFVCLYLAVLYV